MKPEKCFYAKVNRFDFVFRLSWFSLSRVSLAKGFFFMVRFPHFVSNFESKIN